MRMPGLVLVSLAALYSQQAVSQSLENVLPGSWEQCRVVEDVAGIPAHSFGIKLHFASEGILTIEVKAFRDKLCQQQFLSEKEIMEWAPWLPLDSVATMMNPEVTRLTYRIGQKISDSVYEFDTTDESGQTFYTALKLEGNRLWEADSCDEDEKDLADTCTEFKEGEFYTRHTVNQDVAALRTCGRSKQSPTLSTQK